MSNLLVQNIKHTNNTTSMSIDTSGQVTIRGEGSATTTNLQQGLNKAYCTFAQSSSHTIDDSFNISGLSDDGAGQTTVSYTNVFSVAKHPIAGTSNWNGVFTHDTYTTGSNQIRGRGADSTSLSDRGTMTMLCGGSLA